MIDFVRSWLIGVTVVAILVALAEALMPEGGVKPVGKLVCGLVLLVAVLSPILSWRDQGTAVGISWTQQMEEHTQQLEKQQQIQLKTIIEEQCVAYILDKAKEMGLTITANVTCVLGEGDIFLPVQAELAGELTAHDAVRLTALVEEDLGISSTSIVITEEDGV